MLLESTLHASPMVWRRRHLNSASIANSIQRRLKNSSFSTIPVVAHASAWLWIGKLRICRLGNRMHPTANLPLTNQLSPSKPSASLSRLTRVLRRRRGSKCEFALPHQHQISNVNERVREIRENSNRIASKNKVNAHEHATGNAPVP